MTLQLTGQAAPEYTAMLTPDALAFIADLVRAYNAEHAAQISQHQNDQRDDCPDEDTYTVNAADLNRIITIVTNGAPVIIADFEDCTPPTWEDLLRGQSNLRDLTRFNVDYQDQAGAWHTLSPEQTPPLMVRPRALTRPETHITLDSEPIPAGLFDFGLHMYYNAAEMVVRGMDVTFSIKPADHAQMHVWQQIAGRSSATLGLPTDRVKIA